MIRHDYDPQDPNGAAVAAGVIAVGLAVGIVVLGAYVLGTVIFQAVMGA